MRKSEIEVGAVLAYQRHKHGTKAKVKVLELDHQPPSPPERPWYKPDRGTLVEVVEDVDVSWGSGFTKGEKFTVSNGRYFSGVFDEVDRAERERKARQSARGRVDRIARQLDAKLDEIWNGPVSRALGIEDTAPEAHRGVRCSVQIAIELLTKAAALGTEAFDEIVAETQRSVDEADARVEVSDKQLDDELKAIGAA